MDIDRDHPIYRAVKTALIPYEDEANPQVAEVVTGFVFNVLSVAELDRLRPQRAPTGHVIGATYRSSYWGGTYRVLDSHGACGVLVECVTPGAGAHQTVGERWSHLTPLDFRDERLS